MSATRLRRGRPVCPVRRLNSVTLWRLGDKRERKYTTARKALREKIPHTSDRWAVCAKTSFCLFTLKRKPRARQWAPLEVLALFLWQASSQSRAPTARTHLSRRRASGEGESSSGSTNERRVGKYSARVRTAPSKQMERPRLTKVRCLSCWGPGKRCRRFSCCRLTATGACAREPGTLSDLRRFVGTGTRKVVPERKGRILKGTGGHMNSETAVV